MEGKETMKKDIDKEEEKTKQENTEKNNYSLFIWTLPAGAAGAYVYTFGPCNLIQIALE